MLCERNFSKRLAFSYLEEIAQEFQAKYGKKISSVLRPYSFIEFGKYDKDLKNTLNIYVSV